MAVELVKEKYSGPINMVELGTGPKAVKIGGETALPFLFDEGAMPNAPIVALEILDCEPADWPDSMKKTIGDCINDPAAWAVRCVKDFGAKMLCVRLQSVHPDYGARSADNAIAVIKSILNKADVPLIIVGSGDDDRIIPGVGRVIVVQGKRGIVGKQCHLADAVVV